MPFAAISLFLVSLVVQTADPVVSTQEVGPLFVRLELPTGVIGLSQKIEVGITVQAPERVQTEIRDLEKGQQLGPFEVVSLQKKGADRFEGRFGTLLLSKWVLELEPMQEGTHQPTPLALSYREDGSKEWSQAEVKLPAIQVRADFVGDAATATLRPLPEFAGSAPDTERRRIPVTRMVGVALIAAAVVVAAVTACRRSPNSLQQARRKLAQLEKAGTADYREGITAVSHALREYLHAKYDVSAESQSTPEILSHLGATPGLTEKQSLVLHDFFIAADLDRFAKQEPTRQDWLRLLQQAQMFLAHEST